MKHSILSSIVFSVLVASCQYEYERFLPCQLYQITNDVSYDMLKEDAEALGFKFASAGDYEIVELDEHGNILKEFKANSLSDETFTSEEQAESLQVTMNTYGTCFDAGISRSTLLYAYKFNVELSDERSPYHIDKIKFSSDMPYTKQLMYDRGIYHVTNGMPYRLFEEDASAIGFELNMLFEYKFTEKDKSGNIVREFKADRSPMVYEQQENTDVLQVEILTYGTSPDLGIYKKTLLYKYKFDNLKVNNGFNKIVLSPDMPYTKQLMY